MQIGGKGGGELRWLFCELDSEAGAADNGRRELDTGRKRKKMEEASTTREKEEGGSQQRERERRRLQTGRELQWGYPTVFWRLCCSSSAPARVHRERKKINGINMPSLIRRF